MGQQRKAKRRSNRRRRRRRKFYESPTWTWPQFDPESCQQCGHVIPMHATGWILKQFILCESCFTVLDEESQRRGSVTIAPGVVLLPNDLPGKAGATPEAAVEVAQAVTSAETSESTGIPSADTCEHAVAQTSVEATDETMIDASNTEPTEAVVVATHHVVPPQSGRTFQVNLDYEPLPPSGPDEDVVLAAHHVIALKSDKLFEVNLDYEPLPPSEPEVQVQVESEATADVAEGAVVVAQPESIRVPHDDEPTVVSPPDESITLTAADSVIESANDSAIIDQPGSPESSTEPSPDSTPDDSLDEPQAPASTDALASLAAEVAHSSLSEQTLENDEEPGEPSDAYTGVAPVDDVESNEAVEPPEIASRPTEPIDAETAQEQVADISGSASQPSAEEAVASSDEPLENLDFIESLTVESADDTTVCAPEVDSTTDTLHVAGDEAGAGKAAEATETGITQPPLEMDSTSLPEACESTPPADETSAITASESLDAAPPAPSIPALAAMPVALPALAANADSPALHVEPAPVTPAPEPQEAAPQSAIEPTAPSEPASAPEAVAPTESTVIPTPPVEQTSTATPASQSDSAPPAAEPARPSTSPAPAKARRRRARRRRHPVDAWLEALANEKPEAIVHRAMAKQSYPPGFDPQEHARLLDLANHLRNRWLENAEPSHAARSA